MVEKYSNCSLSLTIREIQFKTTWRFFLTLVRFKKKKNMNNKSNINKTGQQMLEGKREPKFSQRDCNQVQPLWKSVWRILKKLKTTLPTCSLAYAQRTQLPTLLHLLSHGHHCSIQSSCEMETTPMSFTCPIHNEKVAHIYCRVLFICKEE